MTITLATFASLVVEHDQCLGVTTRNLARLAGAVVEVTTEHIGLVDRRHGYVVVPTASVASFSSIPSAPACVLRAVAAAPPN